MSDVATIFNTVDNIVGTVNGDPGLLNDANGTAQVTAIGVSLAIPFATTTGKAAPIVTLEEAAAGLALGQFAADVQAGNKSAAFGDALSFIGDSINAAAAVATQQGIAGKALATEMLEWGDNISLFGLALKDGPAVVMGIPVVASELQAEASEYSAQLNATGAEALPFVNALNQNAGSAFGNFELGLVSVLSNIEAGVTLTGTAFTNAMTALSSSASSSQSALADLLSDSGATAANVTDTVTNNNSYTVTSSGSGMSGTASVSGNTISTTTNGVNGAPNVTESETFGSNSDVYSTVGTTAGGAMVYSATETVPQSGPPTADISGQDYIADLSGASIDIAGLAVVTVAGSANSIAAAAGSAVAIAAGSTGNVVNVNGTGVSVDASGNGETVNSGATVLAGPVENVSYSDTEVSIASGASATVTGTDGTETLNNNVGGSGTIQNTINWNIGGSQVQHLTGLAANETEQSNDYAGAAGTGLLNDIIATYDVSVGPYATGSSIESVLTGLPSGVTGENKFFSGGNGTGANYQINTNNSDGTSNVEFIGAASGIASNIATEDVKYSGTNDSGTNTQSTFNWTAGGSQVQTLAGLPSNETEQSDDYSGAVGTGLLNDIITTFNVPIGPYATGSSIESVLTDLPSGIASENKYFSGGNGTGTNYQINTNNSDGTSQVEFIGAASGIPSNISTEFVEYSGTNDSGTNTQNTYNWAAGGSQVQTLAGLPSNVTEQSYDYSGAVGSGLLNDIITTYNVPIGPYASGSSIEDVLTGLPSNLTSFLLYFSNGNATGTNYQINANFLDGHSQVELFNPSSTVSTQWNEYALPNDGGTNLEDVLNNTNGTSQDQLFTDLAPNLGEVEKNYTSTYLDGTLHSETDIALAGDVIPNAAGATLEIIVFTNTGAFTADFYNAAGYLGEGLYFPDGSIFAGYNAGHDATGEFNSAGNLGGGGAGGDSQFIDDGGGDVNLGDGDDAAPGRGGFLDGNANSSSDSSIAVADDQAITFTGSNNTITLGTGDSVSLDVTATKNSITMTGDGSTEADNGLGDISTVGGTSNTVDISAAAEGTVAAAMVAFDGAVEQIVFAGFQTVNVDSGTEATIIGSDGTLVANNDADGGVIQNIVDWNGGGSEKQTFSTLTDGDLEEDALGYSGSDGSGSILYEQVTTTATNGAISATISGDGADSALNNAAVTLDDSTQASLTNGGNTISAGDGDSLSIVGGFANSIVASGSASTFSDDINSAGNTFTLTGTGNTATIDGANDTVTLGGSSDTANIATAASSGTAIISGTNDTVAIAGASSENVTFDLDGLGTLLLQSTQSFSGTVAGLADGDDIDFAGFQFSGSPIISNITGTGAAGTDTVLTITDGMINSQILLLNQYAAQFTNDASAYLLTADSTQPNAGTLLQLAAGH